MNYKGGFTFVELVIVIMILGVLFALITPHYLNSLKSGRDANRRSDLDAIKRALQEYYGDFQRYPDDDAAGQINGSPWGEEWVVSNTTYINQLPIDPHSMHSYWYEYIGDDEYALESCVERPLPKDSDTCLYLTDCTSGICYH